MLPRSLFTSFKNPLVQKVTRTAGRAGLVAQKHAPTALFAVGVVGFGVTVAATIHATMKAEGLVEEHKEDAQKIQIALSEHSDKYSEEDKKRDTVILWSRTLRKFTVLYGPAAIAGITTLACFGGSHYLLNKRVAGLTSAVATTAAAFKQYRERVIEQLGEDIDFEFRHNTVDVEKENEETGKTETTKVVSNHEAPSMYARFFDEGNANYQKDAQLNRLFLSCQQNYANDLLVARGHVFLNEVYDMLGMERTSAGAVVGWVLGGEGDNFVDFGIFNNEDDVSKRMFVNGDERSVLLDFNVNGVIFDRIA